jgi:hypothetical protein
LKINDNLADSQNKSLHTAYAKYKASNAAVQLYEQMVADGNWPKKYQRVTITEIRQLFISKSVWHAQYVPCFKDITKYEEMLEWLENITDDDVWDQKKIAYHFSDLKEWLDEKQKEKKRAKAKAKKTTKKAKEKGDEKKDSKKQK